MPPVTHYLYLALALFCVGLGGALLRRSLVVVLLSVQLMLASVALLLCAYARMFLDPGGQVAALLVVLVGLCELGVVVAIVLRAVRADATTTTTGPRPRPPGLLDDWAAAKEPEG